jgi:hypothetical protein
MNYGLTPHFCKAIFLFFEFIDLFAFLLFTCGMEISKDGYYKYSAPKA